MGSRKQHCSELGERARTPGLEMTTRQGKDAMVVGAAEASRPRRRIEPNLVELIRAAPDIALLQLDRAADHGRGDEL